MQPNDILANQSHATQLETLADRLDRMISYHPYIPRPQVYRDQIRSIKADLIRLAKEVK